MRECIQVFAFVALSALPPSMCRSELLTKASVAGTSLCVAADEGGGGLRTELGSLGIGASSSDGLGFIVSTKVFEWWVADPTMSDMGSYVPLYLYLTSGLREGRRMIHPVLYLYVGGSLWAGRGDVDYLRVGAGARSTFWLISPGVELSWRAVWRGDYLRGGHWQRCRHESLSVGATLDLGGWWVEQREKKNSGHDR